MITRLLEVPWERKKGGLGTTTRDSYCLLLLLFISPLCFLFTCKCWTGKESFSLFFFFFTRIALEWKENCSGITRLFLKAEIPTAPIDRCNRYCFIHLSFYFRCNSFGHDPIRFCAHYVFFLFTNPLTQHTNKHKKNKTNKIRGVSCLAKNKKLGSSLPAIVNKLFGNVHVWHFWRAFNNRDCESFRSFRIHDSWKKENKNSERRNKREGVSNVRLLFRLLTRKIGKTKSYGLLFFYCLSLGVRVTNRHRCQ